MKKTIIYLVLLNSLLSACSASDSMHVFDNAEAAKLLQQNSTGQKAREHIAIKLPNKKSWQRIDLSFGTTGSPIMLVPISQTYTDWHESIRTQIKAYYHFPDITAKDFIAEKISKAKQECSLVEASTLAANNSYRLYRLNIANCRSIKNQLQIGKVFNGLDAVYVVYYAADAKISAEEINKMTKVIAAAKLVARRPT